MRQSLWFSVPLEFASCRPRDEERPRQCLPTARRTQKTPFLPLAICIFLVVAVAVVFGQTLRHDFVNYDDHEYVYENRHVVNGLTARRLAGPSRSFHAANWHPLTWLSHMLDCQFYGPAMRPGAITPAACCCTPPPRCFSSSCCGG